MGCIFKTAPAADSRNLRDHDYVTGPFAQGQGFLNQKLDSDCWTRHRSPGHGEPRKQGRLRHDRALLSALNTHASGLSAVEWSPFRPIQSRRVQLVLGPSSSSIFCCKKRAFSHLYAHGEILHPFERERHYNFDAQGGPLSTISCRTKLGGDRHQATPQPS